jgi:hypothetical protein
MPCTVKKTFEEAGAVLIAQVKDNQPTLLQRAEQVCQTTVAGDQNATRNAKRRSRDETRVVEVFDPDAALKRVTNPDRTSAATPVRIYIFGVSNACASLALFCAATISVCLRASFTLASASINAAFRTASVVSGMAPLP